MVGSVVGVVERGYGFVKGDETGLAYFFHHTHVEGDFGAIWVGARVEFTPEDSERGPRASAVRLVGSVAQRSAEAEA